MYSQLVPPSQGSVNVWSGQSETETEHSCYMDPKCAPHSTIHTSSSEDVAANVSLLHFLEILRKM